jgi:hypothetical protein
MTMFCITKSRRLFPGGRCGRVHVHPRIRGLLWPGRGACALHEGHREVLQEGRGRVPFRPLLYDR